MVTGVCLFYVLILFFVLLYICFYQNKGQPISQVGHLGNSYLRWVHRPAPGQPRFFRSPALEYLTKTPWWVAWLDVHWDLQIMLQHQFRAVCLSAEARFCLVTASGSCCFVVPVCRWVVPLIWVPIILACLRRAFLGSHLHYSQPMLLVAAGVLLWQLLEYCIHR